MKLGKKVRKVKESQPTLQVRSEPKVYKRRHTVCKITEESTDLLFDNGLNLMVEGSGEILFEREVIEILPKKDLWKKENVLHINPKYKNVVISLAKDYFSEILLFDTNGKLTKVVGNFP